MSEWSTISYQSNKKGRKIKNFKVKNPPRKVETEVAAFRDIIPTSESIEKCSTFIRYNEETVFRSTLYYHQLSKVLNRYQQINNQSFQSLVLLGLGSFLSKNESDELETKSFLRSNSFWQLILGLNISNLLRSFNIQNLYADNFQIVSYDPMLINTADRMIYSALNINHITENIRQNLTNFSSLISSDKDGPIHFFYMPHCPYRLYCNILYSYWNRLDQIAIFGNSFQSYSLRRMGMTDKNNRTDLVNLFTPFFEEIACNSFDISKKSSLPLSEEERRDWFPSRADEEFNHHFESAFSDLSLMFITTKDLQENQQLRAILQNQKPTIEEMEEANQLDVELF